MLVRSARGFVTPGEKDFQDLAINSCVACGKAGQLGLAVRTLCCNKNRGQPELVDIAAPHCGVVAVTKRENWTCPKQ
jgi:hypothetical protein